MDAVDVVDHFKDRSFGPVRPVGRQPLVLQSHLEDVLGGRAGDVAGANPGL